MNYAELYLKSNGKLLGADISPREESLAHYGRSVKDGAPGVGTGNWRRGGGSSHTSGGKGRAKSASEKKPLSKEEAAKQKAANSAKALSNLCEKTNILGLDTRNVDALRRRENEAAVTGLKALKKMEPTEDIDPTKEYLRDWFVNEDQTVGYTQVADWANQGKTAKDIRKHLKDVSEAFKNFDMAMSEYDDIRGTDRHWYYSVDEMAKLRSEGINVTDAIGSAMSVFEFYLHSQSPRLRESSFIDACVEVASGMRQMTDKEILETELMTKNGKKLQHSDDELYHYQRRGAKWGVHNGPPYPLDRQTARAVTYGHNPGTKRKMSFAEWYAAHKKKKQEKDAERAKAAEAKRKADEEAAKEKEKADAEAAAKKADEDAKKKAEKEKAEEERIKELVKKAINSGDPDFVLKNKEYLSSEDMQKAIDRVRLNQTMEDLGKKNKKTMGERVDNLMKWVERGTKIYNLYADHTATKDIKRKLKIKNKLAELDPNDPDNAEEIKELKQELNKTIAKPRVVNAFDYVNKLAGNNGGGNNPKKDNNQQNQNKDKGNDQKQDDKPKNDNNQQNQPKDKGNDQSNQNNKPDNKSDNQPKQDYSNKKDDKKDDKKDISTYVPKLTAEENKSATDYLTQWASTKLDKRLNNSAPTTFDFSKSIDVDDFETPKVYTTDQWGNRASEWRESEPKKNNAGMQFFNVDNLNLVPSGYDQQNVTAVLNSQKKKKKNRIRHSDWNAQDAFAEYSDNYLMHYGRSVKDGAPGVGTGNWRRGGGSYRGGSSSKKKTVKVGNTLDSPLDKKASDYVIPLAASILSLNPIATAVVAKKLIDNSVANSRVKSEDERVSKLEIDPKTGFHLKDKEWTPEQDMAVINPGYKNFKQNTKQNCSHCTAAYELRRRGYDVRAIPDVRGETIRDMMMVFPKTKLNDLYAPVKTLTTKNENGKADVYVATISTQEKYDALSSNLLKHGDGARGNLSIVFSNLGGHSVVWENQNNKVIIRDCQSNKTYSDRKDVEKLLQSTIMAKYYRTDNVDFDVKKAKEFVQ